MKSKIKKKNYFVFEGLTFRLFSCDFRMLQLIRATPSSTITQQISRAYHLIVKPLRIITSKRENGGILYISARWIGIIFLFFFFLRPGIRILSKLIAPSTIKFLKYMTGKNLLFLNFKKLNRSVTKIFELPSFQDFSQCAYKVDVSKYFQMFLTLLNYVVRKHSSLFAVFKTAARSSRRRQQSKIGLVEELMKITVVEMFHTSDQFWKIAKRNIMRNDGM